MIRRRSVQNNDDNHRWLVSYSDFITLLFAFFVVMYSVSQVNENKYKTLSETLSVAFPSQNKSSADSNTNEAENTPQLANLDSLSENMQSLVNQYNIEGSVQLSGNQDWLELSLDSETLFDSAKAAPSDEAQSLFYDLAATISGYENDVQVSGHTDNVPINNSEFSSNWALSSARAISIVNILNENGVSAQRLSALAYGEFRPIADNATEEGRRKNRRVVLRIAKFSTAAPVQNTEEIVEELLPTDSSSETDSGIEALPETINSELPVEGSIQPVRLRGGDLLFTSDPDLPRLREIENDE